ncbi:hypothetical protein P167DRAFT_533592 [Morchella conica CCBAS932]|uniref:Glutathione S-transferase n=1 Tax=Morchella conica CCBAS932 TaxID=1392247 RepID=A0A3N4LAH5_9PEZI|nr:hypothetical protein P167DRAFT_533592 [Morchella conica CCBAS932]
MSFRILQLRINCNHLFSPSQLSRSRFSPFQISPFLTLLSAFPTTTIITTSPASIIAPTRFFSAYHKNPEMSDPSPPPLPSHAGKAPGQRQQKTYPKKASGQALQTVKRHSKPNELKLFGSCFCPFVQRVWIALEVKGLNYQYIEVDPYKKPQSLLDINPRGLVPALKHGDWGCYESTVLLDYLEDLGVGTALLPEHPQVKATSRLWVDHVNRNIVPGFYRYLQAQEQQKQVELAEELRIEIAKIVDAADVVGPFFLGPFITFVDVSIAPWLLRLSRVLHPYKGWPLAQPGTRLAAWINALEGSEAVGNTLSDPVLYLENYERESTGYEPGCEGC